jgi:hypothetical protein
MLVFLEMPVNIFNKKHLTLCVLCLSSGLSAVVLTKAEASAEEDELCGFEKSGLIRYEQKNTGLRSATVFTLQHPML